jgi:hypothetical protein
MPPSQFTDLIIFLIFEGNDDGIDLNGKGSLQPNLTSEQDSEKAKLMEEYKEELSKVKLTF